MNFQLFTLIILLITFSNSSFADDGGAGKMTDISGGAPEAKQPVFNRAGPPASDVQQKINDSNGKSKNKVFTNDSPAESAVQNASTKKNKSDSYMKFFRSKKSDDDKKNQASKTKAEKKEKQNEAYDKEKESYLKQFMK